MQVSGFVMIGAAFSPIDDIPVAEVKWDFFHHTFLYKNQLCSETALISHYISSDSQLTFYNTTSTFL